jgi:hypothetical protein
MKSSIKRIIIQVNYREPNIDCCYICTHASLDKVIYKLNSVAELYCSFLESNVSVLGICDKYNENENRRA